MRSFGSLLAIAALLAVPAASWADFTVSFTPPALADGMESLETLLDEQAEPFLDGVIALAEEASDKPLLLSAFAGASATAAILGLIPFPGYEISFALGATVAAWADSYSASTIDSLTAMSADSDVEAGIAAQPMVIRASIPLRVGKGSLRIEGGLGFSKLGGEAFSLDAFSAGAGAVFTIPGARVEGATPLRWEGVSVAAGAEASFGALGMTLQPGPIYQTVVVDPDGDGPLVGLSARILVDPTLGVSIRTSSYVASLGAFTGLRALSSFSVKLGGGASIRYASSALGIVADEAVIVDGYLGELVVEDGRITISGSTEAKAEFGVAPFIAASLDLGIGSFDLHLPLIWSIPKGLGFGMYVAVRPW